jgi:hypothetical protein
VVASADRVPPHDRFPASEAETESAAIGVSAARRLIAIVAWWIGATLALLLVLVAIMLPLCDEQARCSAGPSALVAVANLLWGVAMASIPALGWFGRLPGARACTDG